MNDSTASYIKGLEYIFKKKMVLVHLTMIILKSLKLILFFFPRSPSFCLKKKKEISLPVLLFLFILFFISVWKSTAVLTIYYPKEFLQFLLHLFTFFFSFFFFSRNNIFQTTVYEALDGEFPPKYKEKIFFSFKRGQKFRVQLNRILLCSLVMK